MHPFTITDVRALPGDSAFLIDDGKTSILCDSGFAFTGEKIAQNIKNVLQDRALDYIFLTHSHYDHALASAYIAKTYPKVKIVASSYAKRIFEKPTARQAMRELDKTQAKACGVKDYPDYIDDLRVDIPVEGGEVMKAGDMAFEVIALPGHTKCSIGFYLAENKLLISNETLGVYFENELILPAYLVGYQQALQSIKRAQALGAERLLLPHYGLVEGDKAAWFLSESETSTVRIAEQIKAILQTGGKMQEALDFFKARYYQPCVQPIYPPHAFTLNTRIMIERIQSELL